jgi:hypothetical protein
MGRNMLVDGEWKTDIEPYTAEVVRSIALKPRFMTGFRTPPTADSSRQRIDTTSMSPGTVSL